MEAEAEAKGLERVGKQCLGSWVIQLDMVGRVRARVRVMAEVNRQASRISCRSLRLGCS